MCGIAGIWHLNGRELELSKLRQFTDALSHRGPDSGDYKIFDSGTLGLGHRRLSILDLSAAGCQPMEYLNGRYTIVYNGEVFNFVEIRNELKKKGYQFINDTDTEVILAAFHYWGKDCLYQFNGMWAFAIWDELEQELWLARDRYGIKPFYFHFIPNHIFAFASETNAFSYLADFDKQFDEQNVKLAIGDPFALEGFGKTIFNRIESLQPGNWMSIKKDADIIEKKWWKTTDNLPPVPTHFPDQVEAFRDLFADACKLRLRSDVSIGTALSGGLDSSAVYCMLHKLKNDPFITERLPNEWQKAYSAIFPGTEQDEQLFAREVVDYVGGEVVWIHQSSNELADKIINSTRQLDFIYNTPLFIGSDIYKGMHANGIKVSMDGHGVDEMLYGYGFAVRELADKALHSDATSGNMYWDIYKDLFQDEPIKPEVYSAQLQHQNGLQFQVKAKVKQLLGRRQPDGYLNDILHQQFHQTMLPTILRNFDKMAMQHGIEIRMPFMDWRLVTFIFALPISSKIGDGFTKRILRDAMKGMMPENVRTRKLKTGLNAPMQSWFGKDLKPFVMDCVNSTSFQQSNIWDGKQWQKFVESKASSSSWSFNEAISFWPVLNANLLINK